MADSRTISQLEAERYDWIGCECCKGTVWVPFRMIRERIPTLSAAIPPRKAGRHTRVCSNRLEMAWSRPFDDPITLPDGRQLVTLLDAGNYITELPKADQQLDEWQTAVEALMMVAEGRGPLMHARIGMLRALNRHVERVFNPDRKDTHWGKRKLRRAE
jgi:hypothetical protein